MLKRLILTTSFIAYQHFCYQMHKNTGTRSHSGGISGAVPNQISVVPPPNAFRPTFFHSLATTAVGDTWYG
jgi:hypothetical protein